jgi:hypothetical protein
MEKVCAESVETNSTTEDQMIPDLAVAVVS